VCWEPIKLSSPNNCGKGILRNKTQQRGEPATRKRGRDDRKGRAMDPSRYQKEKQQERTGTHEGGKIIVPGTHVRQEGGKNGKTPHGAQKNG